jgi:hypothetical protein
MDIPYPKDVMDQNPVSQILPRKFYIEDDCPPQVIPPWINYKAQGAQEIEARMEKLVLAGIYQRCDVP